MSLKLLPLCHCLLFFFFAFSHVIGWSAFVFVLVVLHLQLLVFSLFFLLLYGFCFFASLLTVLRRRRSYLRSSSKQQERKDKMDITKRALKRALLQQEKVKTASATATTSATTSSASSASGMIKKSARGGGGVCKNRSNPYHSCTPACVAVNASVGRSNDKRQKTTSEKGGEKNSEKKGEKPDLRIAASTRFGEWEYEAACEEIELKKKQQQRVPKRHRVQETTDFMKLKSRASLEKAEQERRSIVDHTAGEQI